ncbi:LapD/MoxY N-terminal periplasmic domain-containing protein [Halomonas sabkhae]|uniref:bifunctional diguanylate cyclase/phosphodiesterase n=1 Tax=Halomonas sabkhae TaxID=626223 RepID=UPI0025B425A9|nr:LapD/MoxY N-terminal periplasmic domain-containing protein [Halomonas sabkhae]MDN3526342.1 LapD/MoxY N-terminal periplasmic domain-containing protein [Halomonas sabkhae]
MSLIKQLWLIILGLLILAFSGSLFISVTSSHDYIERSIRLKNADNANALALTMSQLPKDGVTLELLASAQFDTGHYRLIELRDTQGAVITRHQAETGVEDVPKWFVELIEFNVPPGEAKIQDGWQQFATLTLEGQHGFAYRTLWRSTLALTGWFVLAGGISLALAWWLVRRIRLPLRAVIDQAQNIGQRRFTTAREPRTQELRELVQAMNRLSTVVGDQLGKEGQQLESLRRQLQHDAVTDTLQRTTFLDRLKEHLGSQDYRANGMLILLRVVDLAEYNQRFGHAVTDQHLRELADTLTELAAEYGNGMVGRLNGQDFAVLLPGANDLDNMRDRLYQSLDALSDTSGDADVTFALQAAGALISYGPDDNQPLLFSALDNALADAEMRGERTSLSVVKQHHNALFNGQEAWRDALQESMSQGVQLTSRPVIDETRQLVHMEAQPELFLSGEWRHAGIFMPWLTRLNITTQFELDMVDAALAEIARSGLPVSIHLSTASIYDARFVLELRERLLANQEASRKLWLEVPESLATREMDNLRSFCRAQHSRGCHIGLKHVGTDVRRIAELRDVGLDYLKIEAGLISHLKDNDRLKEVLRGIASLCHSEGLLVVAEGATDSAHAQALFELGFDGVAGPGVKRHPDGHHIIED